MSRALSVASILYALSVAVNYIAALWDPLRGVPHSDVQMHREVDNYWCTTQQGVEVLNPRGSRSMMAFACCVVRASQRGEARAADRAAEYAAKAADAAAAARLPARK
eukprot:876089-Pelagomonas_calceolata.AAC.2